MSKAKEIRKRIKSVKNTKKITRTMEMVATSKLKRAMDRVAAARPYLAKLTEILAELTPDDPSELVAKYPLLEQREPKRVMIFLLTANRGLCGGFNANLIRKARELYDEQKRLGREVDFRIAGKKGLSFFRFRNYKIDEAFTDLSDRPTFADADRFTEIFVREFLAKRVDKVFLVSTNFRSAANYPPTVIELLPINPKDALKSIQAGPTSAAASAKTETSSGKPGLLRNFMFAPSGDAILGQLFPLYLRNMMFRALIESVAAEQSARRVAMKNATDNADEMMKQLTRKFNRARQAQITQEIAEIVGGAAALE